MPLPAGTKLGHYEILSPLGAGGMGEVYRARDTRLKRDVALKILPEAFASDPGRMMRFQREAEVLASLNHPNIAQIYGVEERALAMELVEGESPRGPMPFEEAWKIAMQIASALEYAHDKGVIHRDLKPANVKVTPEGVVKLLDFGLAKAYSGQPDNPSGDPSLSPTITLGATVAGTILGTAAYMSPEQARGKNVDKRADIWAWGVVLYELLTGDQMFQGEDAAETLGAVMHKQPDLDRVPQRARRLLGRCLEKDPKKRLRDIGDAKDLLEEPATASSGRGAEARVRVMAGAAALMTVIAAVAVWGWLRTPPAGPRPVMRWQLPLPQGAQATGTGVAISRDGTEIAYAAAGKLWLRRSDQFEAQPVSGTDNGVRPVFSPDGKWIAYFSVAVGPLKKIPVTGGTSITLCENAGFWGGSWSDGVIVFSSGSSLMRVPEQGGKCEPLTKPPPGEIHRWPQILPGGQAVLFTAASGEGNLDTARIAVLDLKTGAYRTLVNGGTNGRYVSSGHLVYMRGGTLFAVPFDLKRLALTGGETPVVEGIYYNPSGGFADYSFSDTGLLAYIPETRATRDQRILAWVDLKGAQQPLPAPPNQYIDVRLSPDGQRAALVISGSGGAGLWVYDLARGTLTRLTPDENVGGSPVWTPDGRRIAFASLINGFGIHWVPADGSGKPEVLLAKTPGLAFPSSWTPDGKTLLYNTVSGGVWMLSPGSSDAKPQALFANNQMEENARISPDGRWVAYESNLSGRFQVYLRPFPGPGGLTPVSVDGGEFPMWSRDGRELFFVGRSQTEMMAVGVETSPALRLGAPRALFPMPPSVSGADAAPDGKRFLFAIVPQSSGNASPAEEKLQVVENWFDELRRLAPAK